MKSQKQTTMIGNYTGVFSHKFPLKTGLTKEMVHFLIKDEDVDVISFCEQEFKNKLGKVYKYLEFTEIVHPGFIEGFTYLCDYLGLEVKEPRCVIYAGQWVAKDEIYKRFVNEILIPAMNYMESDSKMKEYAWKDSEYNKRAGLKQPQLKQLTGLDYYSFHTFFLERLPSIVVDNWNLTFKIKNQI